MKANLHRLGVLIALATSACSVPQAAYIDRDLQPGQLAIVNARGLAVLQGQPMGQRARQLDLNGLRRAVACVPEAVAYVDAAKSIKATGTVMRWIGWATFVASSVALVYSFSKGDNRFITPILIASGGTGIMTRMPSILRPYSLIKAVDAVHAYEDQRVNMPGCPGAVPAAAMPMRRPSAPAPATAPQQTRPSGLPKLPAPPIVVPPPSDEAAPGGMPRDAEPAPGGQPR